MRKVSRFNDGWVCNDRPAQLPHTVTELPLNYFDETLYQGPARYTKTFQFDPSWEGYEVSLHFEAAMANVGDFAEEVFGTWGTDWQGVTIKGYRDGDAVASRAFVADPLPSTLEVALDQRQIAPFEDVRIMVRALDQVGNKLRHLAEPVQVQISGPAKLFGPDLIPLRAGASGFWLRATGTGQVKVTVTHQRFASVTESIIVRDI